jgi:hypothetical protein
LTTRRDGQWLSGEPLAAVADHQRSALRTAVVIQGRLNSLLPLRALLGQRGPQPDPGTQIEDVIGRDPRLRQPLDHQQLRQMPCVRAIALRALLRPPKVGGLRRLREGHLGTGPAQLLDHEPPTRRRLQRDLELLAAETRQELPRRRAVRRRHSRAVDLAGAGVDPLAGDLRSMLIKSHYDAHSGPPQAPRFERLRGRAPRLS